MNFSSILLLIFCACTSSFLVNRPSTNTHEQTLQTTPESTINVCQLPDSRRQLTSGGCNFNNGTCGYDFPTGLWSQHTESAGAITFGNVDDDDNGFEQTYALFMTNKAQFPLNYSSSIITKLIYSHNVCLKFWYLMPNQNSQLKVSVISKNMTSFLIGNTYHLRSQQWRKVEVPIQMHNPFKVAFTSTKENNFGYVGLDSISFDIEKPPSVETTTTVIQATTSIYDTDSPTTETVEESTSATSSTNSITTDQLTTACQCTCPTIPRVTRCQNTNIAFTTRPSTDMPTPAHSCNINPDGKSHLSGSCDFNKDVCGYTVPSYPHLWELTPYKYIYGSPDVGEIKGDHSLDSSGRYMLFNTNNKHVQDGTSGEMTSQLMYANGTTCMEFWYNTPNSVATLEVYLIKRSGIRRRIWTSKGPTSGWRKANVQIQVSGSFQVAFSSTKVVPEAFIGLDDIVIASDDDYSNESSTIYPVQIQHAQQTTLSATDNCNCVCPTSMAHHHCSDNRTPVTTNPLCNSRNILHNASCNFDKGPCGFTIPQYPHLWDITRYDYGNKLAGLINGDHTSDGENGMYAVFDTNNPHVLPVDTEDMTSQLLPPNVTICFSFWYNMPTNKATLNIYKRYKDSAFSDELLWNRAQSKTNDWTKAYVVLVSDKPFQIVFSSWKTGTESYFGVDDIVVHYGTS